MKSMEQITIEIIAIKNTTSDLKSFGIYKVLLDQE
tara:strand:- start:1286 stop:1390 length:105 start_codon:yes stop_codon:yes gene_type:complete